MPRDDLSDLCAGDSVALCYSSYGRNVVYKIARVEKVTPTGLIKVGNEHYTPDGQKRSGSYDSPRLVRLTEEIHSEIERQRLTSEVNALLDKCKIHDLPIDTLRALRAALARVEG